MRNITYSNRAIFWWPKIFYLYPFKENLTISKSLFQLQGADREVVVALWSNKIISSSVILTHFVPLISFCKPLETIFRRYKKRQVALNESRTTILKVLKLYRVEFAFNCRATNPHLIRHKMKKKKHKKKILMSQ